MKLCSFLVVLFFITLDAYAQKPDAYAIAIAKADSAYDFHFTSAKNDTNDIPKYLSAKFFYMKAYSISPKEKYPADRIKEIDKIVERIEKGIYLVNAKTLADSLEYLAKISFNDGEFALARKYYLRADSVKPSAEYRKKAVLCTDAEQIKDIDSLKRFMYDVKFADQLLVSFTYQLNEFNDYQDMTLEHAAELFEKALNINENSVYVNQRIAEVNKYKSMPLTPKQKYTIAIRKGDASLGKGKYEEAQKFYIEALKIQPQELYPKDQLESCAIKIQQNDEAYKKAIAKADQFFTTKKYEDAKKSYQEALKIKPFEKYCEDQIKKIDLILEQ